MKQKKLRNARLCINKFKGKMTCLSSVLLISFLLPACNTVYEAERIDASDLDNEPRVAFVRPDKYSFAIFGSFVKEHGSKTRIIPFSIIVKRRPSYVCDSKYAILDW